MKVNCRGHGEAPNEDQVKVFNLLCEKYMEDHPDDIIGVHCTHGFNRSGYLICAFLCSVWDWDIHAALSHFAKFRPPGIYKQEYINQLCQIYGSPDDGPPPRAPDLPDWCFEDQDVIDDDGFASTSNGNGPTPSTSSGKHKISHNSANGPPTKRKKEHFKENPTFMSGVSGVYPILDRDKLATIQRRVQDMCEWRGLVICDCPCSPSRTCIL